MVSHSRAGVPALTGRLPVPSRRRAVHPGGSGGPRRHGSRPQRDSRPGLPPTGARRRVVGPLAGRHPEPGRPASVRTGIRAIRAVRDRHPPALTPGLHTAPLCNREDLWGGACAPPRSTASACFPPGLPGARAPPAFLDANADGHLSAGVSSPPRLRNDCVPPQHARPRLPLDLDNVARVDMNMVHYVDTKNLWDAIRVHHGGRLEASKRLWLLCLQRDIVIFLVAWRRQMRCVTCQLALPSP